MSSLKLLAISSLPTLGNAGLKNIISIIGDKTIPVPSLIACGLGNMQGHLKIKVPFLNALIASLEIAKASHYELVLYVGYLHHKDQIDAIVDAISTYKNIIKAVVVDPICGDNGQAYVDPAIIKNYGKLFTHANFVLPNETEIRLLTDNNFDSTIDDIIHQFLNKYPKPKLIITSVIGIDEHYNYLIENGRKTKLLYEYIQDANFSGTGDTFAALFIQYFYFQGFELKIAIAKAGEFMVKAIVYNLYLKKEPYDFSHIHLSTNLNRNGKLFYIIGPSGVGKDTLMNIAKKELMHSHVVFANRYITRDIEAGGEDHIPILKNDFLELIQNNYFALWWESHGNYYGISKNINALLENGFNVVLNGSRAYHEKALTIYPEMITILITAKKSTIKARLLGRGRENLEEIENRIQRSENLQSKFENKENVILLSNDCPLEISSQRFIHLLSES